MHQLRQHPDYLPQFSRVAVVDGHVAGVILYTKSRIVAEGEQQEVVTFGPLCADHRYKNCGIGRMLLEETIPLVKAAGYPGILITGEPDYYPKHGFRRARDFGLTTMDGGTYDPFMGLELAEGGLHVPGGKFQESEAFEQLTDEDLAVFEQTFDPLWKTVRPCQWDYDGPTEEQQGYHVTSALHHPRDFMAMYRKYAGDGAEAAVQAIWQDVTKASFVLYAGDQPVGLMVTAAPSTAEEAALYGGALTELFVDEPYRRRGIGSDAFIRFIRQQQGGAAYRTEAANAYALGLWERVLTHGGWQSRQISGQDGHGLFLAEKA